MPEAVSAQTMTVRARQIELPANAGPRSQGWLVAIDCVRGRWCAAGGNYTDRSGRTDAMVVTESSGHWARPLELRMPANAAPDPQAGVASVDCTGIGDCVAVGAYNGNVQGFIATESGGRWLRARLVALPLNSARRPNFTVDGVACTAVGSCVAVGGYQDRSGGFEAFEVTEAGGHWARAATVKMPSSTVIPNTFLGSIACAQTGSCVAVGGFGVDPMAIAAESRGRWHTGTPIQLPAGATTPPLVLDQVSAVTCPSVSSCVAAGR
jgi:hypothetical protein